jgi:hypothetical protein
MDNSPSAPARLLLLRGLAIASLVAAVIHFAVAGEHFAEYWAFGVFMLAAAWLQLAWAVGLLIRPSRAVIAIGAVLNAAIVVVYLVTRTVGDVIGPTPHTVEPVGFGDSFCTACEVIIVAGSVLLLIRPLRRPVTRSQLQFGVGAVAAAAMVLLSVSLVDGGPEMVMTMAAAAPATLSPGSAATSLATDSPAGDVSMPDPGMQMAPGMKMVSSSCTATPTAAQEAATVKLVNATWAADKKYESLAAARAAGFRPLTPPGQPVVHYISPSNYEATLAGGPILDPPAPQSLVYANTPHGAVLVAAMYIAGSRHAATPDPGGCLTQWHVHTNLCFRRGEGVVGAEDPGCPAGSVNRVTPPMLHVWFVPIPGGPTAVDASDAQVVKAAEQVPSPHNGRA